jgi:hypothetical protein
VVGVYEGEEATGDSGEECGGGQGPMEGVRGGQYRGCRGGDVERDNEEGMSLHKILGRSGIMRRGAERDRRCNEVRKISRKSRLTLPLN